MACSAPQRVRGSVAVLPLQFFRVVSIINVISGQHRLKHSISFCIGQVVVS